MKHKHTHTHTHTQTAWSKSSCCSLKMYFNIILGTTPVFKQHLLQLDTRLHTASDYKRACAK